MFFSFELSIITIIAISVAFLCVVFLLAFYCPRVNRVAKYQASQVKEDEDNGFVDPTTLPQASVIIYAQDQTENLAALLPDVLGQDYPAGFEVIVVNEGESDSTSDLVNQLELQHRNLYLTFTPEGARNLSRKKLALTLGIKAARYPVVVITNANVRLNSDRWLQLMTRHFNEGKDVVIGASAIDINDDNRMGKRRRAFDRVIQAIIYLSAAIGHKPYRGDGFNIAYRRDLFFANKGFSSALNLHYGDDDIFINEIVTSDNTAVELTPESITIPKFYNQARAHKELKLRYNFTGKFIKKASPRFFGFSSLMMWLWLAASVVAIVFSLPNLVPTIAVVVLMLAMWIPIVMIWRKAMKALCSRKLLFSLPWLVLTRPIANFLYRIKGWRTRGRNYTWQR